MLYGVIGLYIVDTANVDTTDSYIEYFQAYNEFCKDLVDAISSSCDLQPTDYYLL